MKVLFTGHRGFLGRELIPIVDSNFEIVTYDGDLNNYSELSSFVRSKKIERILHAAARGGRRTKRDEESVLLNNITLAQNIIRLETPSIFFCSGAIYNRATSISEAKEDSALESFPEDFYGQSKFISTLLARNIEYVNTLRFFNVFGSSEGLDRFISFNVYQYINREPMKVYRDFYMDFFFVQDAIFPITDWLMGRDFPKEMNLVYEKKESLIQICKAINQLSNYEVPVLIESDELGSNYTGSGQILQTLNYPLLGLERGIQEVYHRLRLR